MLKIKNLNKAYKNKNILDDISLETHSGKIVGLFGPNGAGKTTLIKCIVGLLSYDSGEVEINNSAFNYQSKSLVAYYPDREFLYDWMTIEQALDYFSHIFKDFDIRKAFSLIESLGLDPKLKIRSCSKGMLEQINMSIILSRNAIVYVLDEPLAAVDPLTRDKIIDLVQENLRKDSTMLISTHLINDVEQLFDEVIFINKGKILLHESVNNLKKTYSKSIEDIFKEKLR